MFAMLVKLSNLLKRSYIGGVWYQFDKLAEEETDFKEWRLVVQEIVRFTKSDSLVLNVKPLRYTSVFDSHPASLPYVAKFHAKRLLKIGGALLTSYHKNEVKFAELTLDTFRMMQCLEWEPSGSSYGKHHVELQENVRLVTDHYVTSRLIDINLVADMTDPSLPPNPKKAVLYRPSMTQLLAGILVIVVLRKWRTMGYQCILI